VTIYGYTEILATIRDDLATALHLSVRHVELTREHEMADHRAVGEIYFAWSHSRMSREKSDVAQLRQAIDAYLKRGTALAPYLLGLLAAREADTDDSDAAIATIEDAISRAGETGERFTDAFLHRVRGDILLKRDPGDRSAAEQAFEAAIAVARQQGARSLGLQAALAAKLYQSTGRPVEAHAILAPALEGFAPTPEMPEILEAQTLLAEIS